MLITAPARGSDASGIERRGNVVQARYTGCLRLGDDGGHVGSARSCASDAVRVGRWRCLSVSLIVRRNAVTPTNTGSRRNLVGADQAGSIGRAGYPNGYSRACNNR